MGDEFTTHGARAIVIVEPREFATHGTLAIVIVDVQDEKGHRHRSLISLSLFWWLVVLIVVG